MRVQQTKQVLQSFFLQNWPEHKTQQQIEDGKSEALESWETGLERVQKNELNI
jgi:hypothetical protein